jgi:broad specificity phosphatase PhoE
LAQVVSTSTGRFSVHSEARGPHWIAWLTRDPETRPVRDVVVVGETRQEAESRARAWLEEAQARGYV